MRVVKENCAINYTVEKELFSICSSDIDSHLLASYMRRTLNSLASCSHVAAPSAPCCPGVWLKPSDRLRSTKLMVRLYENSRLTV